MWYDFDGNVCDIFDFSTLVFSGNTLTYTDDNNTAETDDDKKIILTLASDWKTNGWNYNSDDGFFYYSGDLIGEETKQLLESVELDQSAYKLTGSYNLRLDVLADAIQSSGNAKNNRDWPTTS